MDTLRRLLGLLLVLGYLASPGVVQAARACPHHAPEPAAQPAADAHDHHAAHAPASDSSHEPGAPCSCLGVCVPAGVVALAIPAPQLLLDALRITFAQPFPAVPAAPRALQLAWLLPWPNAPPIHVG